MGGLGSLGVLRCEDRGEGEDATVVMVATPLGTRNPKTMVSTGLWNGTNVDSRDGLERDLTASGNFQRPRT